MISNTNGSGNWWETLVGSQIISKKYFHPEESTFEQFTDRVSSIFSTEEFKVLIKEAMVNADLFFGGRTLYAAGSKGKFKSSTSNCYILESPEDNIESIFNTAREMARIYSYGGGCGVNISNLRPSGSLVSNAARSSTGSVSFTEIYDSIGQVIGANNRRSALMIGLDSWHPDLEDFLDAKKNNVKLQSANLSILFHDDFLQAVKDGKEYELKFTVEATGEVISKTIDAKAFFMRFCENNYNFAEPGAIFIDNVRKHHLISGYPKELYNISISNPCSEFFGNGYNSCNLGSVNLYNVISDPFTSDAKVDFDKLENIVKIGVRALDEILTYGRDLQPLEENKQCIDDWRAIGLGVFGLGDALIALGVKYGSKDSIEVTESIMKFVFHTALEESAWLAKEQGTFGKYNWEYIKESQMIKDVAIECPELYQVIKEYGLRNCALLAIAPTGSISTMAGVSGGVEPLYSISYERTTHALEGSGETFKVYAKSVEDLLSSKGLSTDLSNEAIEEMFEQVVVSHNVNPLDRINIQSAMQKYTDNAISSTVNLKNSATIQDVYNLYMYAWSKSLKGITVFRDGCARTSILGKDKPKETTAVTKLNHITPMKRRSIGTINGSTVTKHTSCSPNMYVTVNSMDGDITEVFTNTSTGCQSNINTITRMASLALRSGVKVDEVTKELRSNTCSACTVMKSKGAKNISISCGAAIAESIEEIYKGINVAVDEFVGGTEYLDCPECGDNTLLASAKCPTCSSCGYSKCD